jgi:hypothetical protein
MKTSEVSINKLADRILLLDKAIRFCGIVDKLGHISYQKYRNDIAAPFLTDEENSRYALLTTIRRRPSLPWKKKVGRTQYFVIRNENLIQATIPVSEDQLMLVYFDAETSTYDTIIMKKILPLLRQNENRASHTI